MNKDRYLLDLKNEINALPKGSITKKNIKGKTYFYRRWYEGGVRKEKFINIKELDEIQKKIELRKNKENELKNIREDSELKDSVVNLYTGKKLKMLCTKVKNYEKRGCFSLLDNYIYGDNDGKVFILYGLRRTGKTTMMLQAINEMKEEDFNKSAYILIEKKEPINLLKKALESLLDKEYKYVFIDEITLLKDFIDASSLFSDIYATMGMKIVFSGTDSLSFFLAKGSTLYDRCTILHTTFVPYKDVSLTLGINDIDQYIEYGGTMTNSGNKYNSSSPFKNKVDSDEYINSSIVDNIGHSLSYHQEGGHFVGIEELYKNGELTNVINRIVEDMSHSFTLDVIDRMFTSHDLGISKKNLLKDRASSSDVLFNINERDVLARAKEALKIIEKKDRKVDVKKEHIDELKEYLSCLDIVDEVESINLSSTINRGKRIIISQPGLRYSWAKALIDSLVKDPLFDSLQSEEKIYIEDRILNEIRGRMLEDIVLLETKKSRINSSVFVIKFSIGEFDMVIQDIVDGKSYVELYEIKHSKEALPEQSRNLRDEDKCKRVEYHYGEITKKCVLYRGENTTLNGIEYKNVEEYLLEL